MKACGCLFCLAFPLVSSAGVSVSVDSVVCAGRKTKVAYTLANGPAIVTFDIETNAAAGVWASVGGDKVKLVAGDVNQRVDKSAGSLDWISDESWLVGALAEGQARAVVRAWALDDPPAYLALNLSAPSNCLFFASVESFPVPVTDSSWKKDWLVMRRIPAAGVKWRMGTPTTEANRQDDAATNNETGHYVTLGDDYYISIFQLSARQFSRLISVQEYVNHDGLGPVLKTQGIGPKTQLGYTATRGEGDAYVWPEKGHAVDPTKILGRLRAHGGLAFDLPTEAQWEYACRAGRGTRYFWSDAPAELANPDDALFAYASANGEIAEVGGRKPNPWGLYDMIGNAREVCLDWVGPFSSADAVDPVGPQTGGETVHRVARGVNGSTEAELRIGYRPNDETPTRNALDTALRVVCPARMW